MPATDASAPPALGRHARLAGFLYLTIIVTSLLSSLLVESRLVVDGNPAATIERIAADETLYRAGLVYDTVMFASVIALAWALFVILRGVDRHRALLALLWRVAEAIVGAVTVLFGVLIALLAGDPGVRAAFEPGQLRSLVDVLLAAREVGFDVTIFFLSLGTIVYCRLLYVSRYVPRPLAVLGLVSFVVMLVGAAVNLLLPVHRDIVMAGWAPGIVFEVVIGVWLLVKGVRVPPAVPVPLEAATAHAQRRGARET
ncbi:DUF4386 domain-containing protein [Streptosporangium violaceochromogenes]|nr:DUF4386 domain-containing protein [Streptosporangium violaceochromogenes]